MRVLVVAIVAMGCSADVTAIELSVAVHPAVDVDHYQVALGDRVVVTDPEPTLRLVLPNDIADGPQLVSMWGLHEGQQVAFGTVEVTPIAGEVVYADLALVPAACGADGCCTDRYYVDSDGDGHGDPARWIAICTPVSGHVTSDDDCDDADPTSFPSATESCDGRDNDCSVTTVEVCPSGCTVARRPAPDDRHIYLFCTSLVTRPTAAASCAEHGFTLVQIDDATENAWVVGTAPPTATTSQGDWLYLGGSDAAVEGTWQWDGGPGFWQGTAGGTAIGSRFSAWDGGEPNSLTATEDCAVLRNNGRWNDVPCSLHNLAFVCERSE